MNPWGLTQQQERVLLVLTQVHSRKKVALVLKLGLATIDTHIKLARLRMGQSTTIGAILVYDRWRRSHQSLERKHVDSTPEVVLPLLDARSSGPCMPAAEP